MRMANATILLLCYLGLSFPTEIVFRPERDASHKETDKSGSLPACPSYVGAGTNILQPASTKTNCGSILLCRTSPIPNWRPVALIVPPQWGIDRQTLQSQHVLLRI
jgi:hypothetical protein